MHQTFRSLKKRADQILDAMGVVLFLIIFAVVLLQVFMRYFLGSPLIWSEELARYLFVWVSFIGWIYATRSGTHIRISAVTDLLPPFVRHLVNLVNLALVILFSVILMIFGFRMMINNFDIPTVTLFFTYAFVYAAVPVCCVCIIFYAVFRFIEELKPQKGDTP